MYVHKIFVGLFLVYTVDIEIRRLFPEKKMFSMLNLLSEDRVDVVHVD